MFPLIASTFGSAPQHVTPIHDCLANWSEARQRRAITHCRGSVRDDLGVRRAVVLTVQHLHPTAHPDLGVHWWGDPDTTQAIEWAGRAAVQERWAYEDGARLTREARVEIGVLAVTVDVKSDDAASAERLALAVADGARFEHLHGTLPPFDTATTWVDLPTHDCRAVPEVVTDGRIAVRCEATFQHERRWRLVTYEVAQTFVDGRTPSLGDVADPGARTAHGVHQGHPAEDRVWTDDGGAHRARLVERDGVVVTMTVTVHDHGDDAARALGERILDGVDVRALR